MKKKKDSRNHLRARVRADRHTKDEVVDDLVDLLSQIHLIEHAQDGELIKQIEQKYGYRPFE